MKYLVFTICLLCSQMLYATHLQGGYISLKWVSGNTYDISLFLFMDPDAPAGPDKGNTYIGLFNSKDAMIMNIDMGYPLIELFQFESWTLPKPPNDTLRSSFVSYVKRITFSSSLSDSNGYYFVYERCCRQNETMNIDSAGLSGMALYLKVPSFQLHNTTPTLSRIPMSFVIADTLSNYAFTFLDLLDFDSIVYQFSSPLSGHANASNPIILQPLPAPYPLLNWRKGYNDTLQILGQPSLQLNKSTGLLTLKADTNSPGYHLISMKILEYRSNKLLSETHFETVVFVSFIPKDTIPIHDTIIHDTTTHDTTHVGLRSDIQTLQNAFISPNPANGLITINNLKSTSNKPLTWVISDLNGRVIQFHTIEINHSGNTEINISGLEQGVYFITLVLNQNSVHRKLVINQ